MFTLPEDDDVKNRREAFRLDIGPHHPVRLRIAGAQMEITNLSATGIAFRSPDPLAVGAYKGVLGFRVDQVFRVPCTVNVVAVTEGICRAVLEGVGERDQVLLSRFLLHLQKQQIRAEVAAKKSDSYQED